MKISTKGRYGLRSMLDLALYSTNGHVALGSIAERQNISANYLEQVFSPLRKAGLVQSIKGAQGGYVLGDAPSKITVGQILRVLEGDLFQLGEEPGSSGKGFTVEYCLKNSVWDRLQTTLNDLLDSISLEDLMNDYHRMNGSLSYMYHI